MEAARLMPLQGGRPVSLSGSQPGNIAEDDGHVGMLRTVAFFINVQSPLTSGVRLGEAVGVLKEDRQIIKVRATPG